MKTLILYYSYSGHTSALAQALAAQEPAQLLEIKDKRRPSLPKALAMGVFFALRGRGWAIAPLSAALNTCERIRLFAPIWAGNVPPAINAALELLPAGKTVEATLVSGSGQSKCEERLKEKIANRGSSLVSCVTVKV
ncbi:MAG: hypothetical protein LBQ33_01675 [Oscillospiraceae bacterium]|jgi:flavodoxin|nr:hypothetical protein [Oscillospiraceae bacterium]